MPQLIIVSGLPGTGKSALAEAIGHELGVPVFAKDWLEATIRRCGLNEISLPKGLGYIGYELLTTLALRQLQIGQSVILDSVASTEDIREQWRKLAQAYSAEWRVIECVCSDENVHRSRLKTRQRNIPGWHELEWSEVERVRGYFVPWVEPRLILDMINPLEENLASALGFLRDHSSNKKVGSA